MKRLTKLCLFSAAFVLCLGTAASVAAYDEAQAAELFKNKCGLCHGLNRTTKKHKSEDGWTTTVKRMQKKNPGEISDEDAATIIEYLSKTQGE